MRSFLVLAAGFLLLSGCPQMASVSPAGGYGASKETPRLVPDGTVDGTIESPPSPMPGEVPGTSEATSGSVDPAGNAMEVRRYAAAGPIDPKTDLENAGGNPTYSCLPDYRIRYGEDTEPIRDTSTPRLIMSDAGISDLPFRLEASLRGPTWFAAKPGARVRMIYYPAGNEGTPAQFIDARVESLVPSGPNLSFSDVNLTHGLIAIYLMQQKDCSFASTEDHKGLVGLSDSDRDSFIEQNKRNLLGKIIVTPSMSLDERRAPDTRLLNRSVSP